MINPLLKRSAVVILTSIPEKHRFYTVRMMKYQSLNSLNRNNIIAGD